MQKKEFKETSGFPNFIIIIFLVQFIFFLVYTLKNQENKSLAYFSIGIFLLGVLMLLVRLKVRITKQDIHYGITPFFRKKVQLKEVKSIQLIEISVSDFGGWGIRYSKKYGWGYITSFNYGLFIEKNNAKKLVFSIKNKNDLNEFLDDLEKNN